MEENKSKDADFDFEINEDNDTKVEDKEKVKIEDNAEDKKNIIFKSSDDIESGTRENSEVNEDSDDDFEIIESDEEYNEQIKSLYI